MTDPGGAGRGGGDGWHSFFDDSVPAEGIPPNDTNVDRQHSREYNVGVVVDGLSLYPRAICPPSIF